MPKTAQIFFSEGSENKPLSRLRSIHGSFRGFLKRSSSFGRSDGASRRNSTGQLTPPPNLDGAAKSEKCVSPAPECEEPGLDVVCKWRGMPAVLALMQGTWYTRKNTEVQIQGTKVTCSSGTSECLEVLGCGIVLIGVDVMLDKSTPSRLQWFDDDVWLRQEHSGVSPSSVGSEDSLTRNWASNPHAITIHSEDLPECSGVYSKYAGVIRGMPVYACGMSRMYLSSAGCWLVGDVRSMSEEVGVLRGFGQRGVTPDCISEWFALVGGRWELCTGTAVFQTPPSPIPSPELPDTPPSTPSEHPTTPRAACRPPLDLIVKAEGAKEVQGEYAFVTGKEVNGQPLWCSDTGFFMYSTPSGKWALTKSSSDFGQGRSVATSVGPHGGDTPDRAEGWLAHGNPDARITVSVVPPPLLSRRSSTVLLRTPHTPPRRSCCSSALSTRSRRSSADVSDISADIAVAGLSLSEQARRRGVEQDEVCARMVDAGLPFVSAASGEAGRLLRKWTGMQEAIAAAVASGRDLGEMVAGRDRAADSCRQAVRVTESLLGLHCWDGMESAALTRARADARGMRTRLDGFFAAREEAAGAIVALLRARAGADAAEAALRRVAGRLAGDTADERLRAQQQACFEDCRAANSAVLARSRTLQRLTAEVPEAADVLARGSAKRMASR
eukprot:TRINITY_DN2644_c0_g1_i1.p1 TRINITY_DN2644_c0_g1~~TRINITY_DN2644_c0_g1_i1.p1  ORF type:complete len:668 (+),score=157.56 TRINITY_DN2644_c0_g1_i1:58-2061(+)